MYSIVQGTMKELDKVVSLAIKLWPENDILELKEEFHSFITEAQGAIFLAMSENKAVGFAQVQLRHDYVEGTETSPVGYLEGIYVDEDFRMMGIGKALVQAGEAWAKLKGCQEFASDCLLDNWESLQFHLKVGFIEANRIICFSKKL